MEISSMKKINIAMMLIVAYSAVGYTHTPDEAEASSRPAEFIFKKNHFGFFGQVAESPAVLAGYTVADHLILGLGFTFGYSSMNVDPATNVAATGNFFSSDLMISGQYFAFDSQSLAFGPSLAVMSSLVPGKVFDKLSVVPALAAWYAPFPAPLVIGVSVGVQVNMMRGPGGQYATSANVMTSGLNIGYLIQ